MLRVGLTGGIGSGKSTVARALAELGAVVIDADQLAREVLAPGSEGLAEVVKAFGDDVLVDGALDRAALAAKAFASDEARETLNSITHPRIGALTAERMGAAAEDAIVAHDVPLLVEKGMAPFYHLVIVVHADVELRVKRLVESRGMDEADARSRIAAQASVEQRRAVADVWLDNSGDVPDVTALWRERLVPFEENVRKRRYAAGAPIVVPYDETWPEQARRVAARIKIAAGGRTVEHIGSTAVPGLAAKDVLDFQLGVDSMETADAVAEVLAQAGFPPVPGGFTDTPMGPGSWEKRLHAGADPGRRVNLHVRVEGGPGWNWAIDFRDWVRADADARAEYEELKLGLSKRFAHEATGFNYGDAKGPWMRAAIPRVAAYRGGQTS